MAKRFSNIFRKIKSGLNLVHDIRSYRKHTASTFTASNGKYAIVNLDARLKFDDYGRYFYILCVYLEEAGFEVVVRISLGDFKSLVSGRFYHRFIWPKNYTFIRTSVTPMNSIVLTHPNGNQQVINLPYGHAVLDSGRFDCVAPFPMHPYQIQSYADPAILAELKKYKRTIKMLFSGQAMKFMYADARVKKFFNILSRLEVIDLVLTRFKNASRHLHEASDKQVLEQLIDSEEYKNEIIISEVKTEKKDWLKILSKADFFLCPPGAKMPWCHNSVEAMSVGTIPIIEYGDFFSPALEDRKNCLVYKGREGLEAAIKEALTMDSAEIETLRGNVLQYYDEYLSVSSIIKKINNFYNSTQQQLSVAVPFVPTAKESNAIPFVSK